LLIIEFCVNQHSVTLPDMGQDRRIDGQTDSSIAYCPHTAWRGTITVSANHGVRYGATASRGKETV